MGLFSFGKNGAARPEKLSWNHIETVDSLEKALAESSEAPALFFKHSTRCSISSMALNRFESEWDASNHCDIHFIDLIANREVSNRLSELTNVQHQSPQVVLVKNCKAIFNASHSGIDATVIQTKL